jgi:hypothetical protein
MGLLDDAIREHLELKRRRGADPDEIERLEREALGPVRRPQAGTVEVPGADASAGSGVEYKDDERGEDLPGAQDEPSFTDHGAEFADDEEFGDWDAPEREPAPPTPAEEAPASGSLDEKQALEQETVEHDVEGENPEHPEKDDMLEETPDFLQDTPDHDRLWFEQRPPRDFDLDG